MNHLIETRNGNYRALFVAAVLLLTVLSLAAAASAQTAATGALTGTITDPTGAVLPSANVKVTNEVTGEARTATSGANGAYTVPLLPPGSYRVEITQSGFKSGSRTGVAINVAETTKLDVQLAVGAATETVTIEASPAIVQTESNALGRVADERVVVGLPLVTRNYTQIIALSPGIIADVTNAADLGRGRGGVSPLTGGGVYVHGARANDNNFQMNGVGINDFAAQDNESGGVAIPNPDTIQEFKVQTGQYDAAFGRNAGANVNLVTKGGTNNFHGNLFEFFRNDVLNANDFFSNLAGQKKPVLKQNQFGGTLSGPIIKDKLLFFGSYQGTRQANGVTSRRTVFSPALTDDRSAAALGKLFTGKRGSLQMAFGGVGPAIAPDGSNINPAALKLLQLKLSDGSYLFPTPQVIIPSRPFDSQGFSVFGTPSIFDEDQYMINLDFLHTSKSKFSGRYFNALSNQTVSFNGGNTPGFPRDADNRFVTFSLAHSYIFNPNLLNEARFGANRTRTTTVQRGPFKFSDVGITAAPQTDDLPILNISGSYIVGGSFNAQRINNQFTFEDSLSYVRGKHSLRFGGNLTRAQRNFTNFRFNGTLIFLSMADFLLGLSGPANGTGSFSNVFGAVDIVGLLDRAARSWEGALYAQDDFKLSSRLTLNFGLRYERLGLYSDALGRLSAFDATKANPNPPASGAYDGFIVASNFSGGALPAGVIKSDNDFALNGEGQNTFGPRVGFAWKALPNSNRFALRGGYGIYYSRLTGQASFQGNTVPPFGQLRSATGAANASATLTNPFPQPIPPLSSFPSFRFYSPTTNLSQTAVDPNFRPAMTEQYSLNLQTELAKDLLLEIGYVGAHGVHLLRTRSINEAQLASATSPIRGVTTNTVANIRLRVPYLGWTSNGLLQVESAGSSHYNGLEVNLTKRFSRGLQFLASYTYSKSLDTDGANVTATSNAVITVGGQNIDKLRYGPSSFNRPHCFVLSFVYEFPNLAGRGGLLGTLVNGWALTGVTTLQSGQSLTILGNNANNIFGISGADRAQLAAGCAYSQLVNSGSVTDKINNYFNKSCFAAFPVIGDPEPTGQRIATSFGNSGVGVVSGPDQRNFDLSLIKRTKVKWPTEASHIEFRAEFFNAFNTPQFANPDTNFSNATFGQISATAVNPRIIQFALKYNF